VAARLILASASPRRALILTQLGIPFTTVVSHVDETMRAGEDGATAAERLARDKASSVARGRDLPVLGADTVVVASGAVLGKPASDDHAVEMLRRLSGRTHEVITGVALFAGGRVVSGVERSGVAFTEMSDEQIAWYVATGEPRDKAGGYHIDGKGAAFVAGVTGSPSNVAGLPVGLLLRLAREVQLDVGVP
jgi:septum formation protein